MPLSSNGFVTIAAFPVLGQGSPRTVSHLDHSVLVDSLVRIFGETAEGFVGELRMEDSTLSDPGIGRRRDGVDVLGRCFTVRKQSVCERTAALLYGPVD